VNLAVFIGATLRGAPGALAALSGMLLLPIIVVLALGFLYARAHGLPGMETALTGMGAVAIGLNLANGVRLTRRNVADIPGALLMVATALSVGLLRVKLLVALAVLIPLSLLHETLRARRARTRP
jgi:chromate transporter